MYQTCWLFTDMEKVRMSIGFFCACVNMGMKCCFGSKTVRFLRSLLVCLAASRAQVLDAVCGAWNCFVLHFLLDWRHALYRPPKNKTALDFWALYFIGCLVNCLLLFLNINSASKFEVLMAKSESQKLLHENEGQIYSRPSHAARVRSGSGMFY